MTQALLNNLTNHTQFVQDLKKDLHGVSGDIDFQNVLDKKVESIEPTTSQQKTTQSTNTTVTQETITVTNETAQEETTQQNPDKEDTEVTVDAAETETSKEGITIKNLSDLNEEIKGVLDSIGITKDVETEEVSNATDIEVTEEESSLSENTNEEASSTTETQKDSGLINKVAEEVIIQPLIQIDTAKVAAEQEIQVNSEQINEENEDLNVTINGVDLETLLEDFEFKADTQIKISNSEINTTEISEKNLEDLIDEDVLDELNIESVDTETADTGSESADLMQQQTAEEQGVKAMLQTNIDYAEVQTNEIKSVTPTQNVKPASATEITPSKIIEQITKQMEGMHNGSKVNIVLNPEALGKINIQLVNTRDGLSAQLTVATQEARNLLMQGLDGLKDTLLSHGVSVDNVSVKLSESQESEYNSDWTEQEGSEGGRKEQGFNKNQKEKQDFEELMSEDEKN